MNKSMTNTTMWNIRDARGLTTYEKAFLFVVESRGVCTTTRKRLLDDLGISTGQLTKVIRSLAEKDLIDVHEGRWEDGKKTPTFYSVKEDVLATFVPSKEDASPEGVHTVNTPVHDMNTLVHTVNDPVHDMATKGYNKKTDKKTIKKTMGADAPVTQGEVREDVSPSSFDVEKRSVSLLDAKRTAKKAKSVLPEGCPVSLEERTGDHWNAIRKVRPLNAEEKAHLEERSRRFEEARRQREAALAADVEGW